MPQRVLVTGASGFVGRQTVEELLQRGFDVTALVNRAGLDSPAVRSVVGGLFSESALASAAEGCSAVIHLVGIIVQRPSEGVTFERIHVEGTQRVLKAARQAGVRRFVHMSALGSRPDAPAEYHRTKFAAEEAVRASGLDWTILRPSLIHGPRGQFMRMVAEMAHRRRAPYFFMPYFGRGPLGLGGSGLIQPVWVADVARAFVEAIDNRSTFGRSYDLAGPEAMDWKRFYRIVTAKLVGRARWCVPIPAWKAKLLTRLVPAPLLPFNRDQVLMSQEDNVADIADFVRDFGWTPRSLEETLGEYVAELRVA